MEIAIIRCVAHADADRVANRARLAGPVALAEDGTVYLLYANHKDGSAFESTKEYAGQNVVITGIMATQAGIKGLEVSSVKPL